MRGHRRAHVTQTYEPDIHYDSIRFHDLERRVEKAQDASGGSEL
jgi:hypothetical protein